MTVTRVQSVQSRSGSTVEAIKSLVSCSIRELKETLIVSGGVETTSHPKPVSVKTMNKEIKSKKYQLTHHGKVVNTEQFLNLESTIQSDWCTVLLHAFIELLLQCRFQSPVGNQAVHSLTLHPMEMQKEEFHWVTCSDFCLVTIQLSCLTSVRLLAPVLAEGDAVRARICGHDTGKNKGHRQYQVPTLLNTTHTVCDLY